MLLEEVLETPYVARRIDEEIALAALDEVRMRSVRSARIEPASENAVRDLLWKVGLGRTSSAVALYGAGGTDESRPPGGVLFGGDRRLARETNPVAVPDD
jgi:hypothetical protein